VVLLTNPHSKRTADFLRAASARGWPAPLVVDWADWLDRRVSLASVLRPGDWLRLESPGESWEIERRFLELGIEPLDQEGGHPLSAGELLQCAGSRGVIHRPRQWYLGLCRALDRVEIELAEFETAEPLSVAGSEDRNPRGVACFIEPREVAVLFDKGACQPLFEKTGLPIPPFRMNLPSYDEIRHEYRDRQHARLMLKLRHGFSAIGAVALEWHRSRVRAITTTERLATAEGDRLFLSKRVHHLLNEVEIASLIDRFALEGLIVEDWLPKDRIDGQQYDVRALVIDGRLRHVVGRGSASPFTNLNLDGKRIDASRIESRLGDRWHDARRICEQAAGCFPGALTVGVDLLIRPNQEFALLEANAFGDNLPGLLEGGEDPHGAQLQAIEQRMVSSPLIQDATVDDDADEVEPHQTVGLAFAGVSR
ncbi:MAG: STM4014 family protein, partial [Planctomycetota bacterium]|nr:STM4014 family protein [Planctomycetota bacterium]